MRLDKQAGAAAAHGPEPHGAGGELALFVAVGEEEVAGGDAGGLGGGAGGACSAGGTERRTRPSPFPALADAA